ncbi:MAG: hypothetical protein ACMUHB_00565 [Thermoplasmatota archaeon]
MTSYQDMISQLSVDLVTYRKRSDRLMLRVPDEKAGYYDLHVRWERKFRKVERFLKVLRGKEIDLDMANRRYLKMRKLLEGINYQMNELDRLLINMESGE